MKVLDSIIEGHKKELKEIQRSLESSYIKMGKSVQCCQKTLGHLRSYVSNSRFKKPSEEIYFFKCVKPVPTGDMIYYTMVKEFEYKFPKADRAFQKKCIKRKIKSVHKFYKRNHGFVAYIEENRTHFDSLYFTRNKHLTIASVDIQGYYHVPEFSCPYDWLLAKMRSHKLFLVFLQKRLHAIESKKDFLISPNIEDKNLSWTASRVAITELIYALYHGGCINHGKADLKDIANKMQSAFNFQVGDIYKIYSEIKMRKKSRTKFLDELSTNLITKTNQSEL